MKNTNPTNMPGDDCGVSFEYTFSSGLGAFEHSRFIQEVFLRIDLTDEDGVRIEKMGHVRFMVVHIDHALGSDYSLFEILDGQNEYLARHIFNIIDLESEVFNEVIEEHYNFDIISGNVCLIEEVSIFPKFRGFGIGAKAIKDIVFHYDSACSLFVIQPYPIQFDVGSDRKTDIHLMEVEKLEKNEGKAFEKLTNYYESIGFESIKGIEDLLFYNPIIINEAMDRIDLEEEDLFSKD